MAAKDKGQPAAEPIRAGGYVLTENGWELEDQPAQDGGAK